MIERVTELNLLLDFYNSLITKKQRYALEMYYSEDLSLAEIAENLEISRQAIHDLLRRGEKLLDKYEKKLGLVRKYQKRKDIVNEIISIMNTECSDSPQTAKKEILRLLNQIIEQED